MPDLRARRTAFCGQGRRMYMYEESMKEIKTGGIGYVESLSGSGEWYWGTDRTSGDLYEAEELYERGHRINSNRLILVHYPDGRVIEPVRAREGQYFGRPVWDGDSPVLLLADFPARELRLLRCDALSGETAAVAVIKRSEIKDCYNLMPHVSPLMLTRQETERFETVWPVRASFAIHAAETFCFRDGDRLFFSRWYEDPDYREETVVRHFPDGEILDSFPGSLIAMPDGSQWLLV